VVQSYKPVAVRRCSSRAPVEILTDLLKGVVRNGTGEGAALPGYTVAGKTAPRRRSTPRAATR
jgi:membrane peptidoglycan carboxypeptidase